MNSFVWTRRALPWVVPALILLAWQYSVSHGAISSRVMPSPLAVVETGWKMSADGVLFHHLGISFQRAMTGLLIGGSIGFILALSNGLSKWSHLFFDSSIQMLRNVPNLALIPLVILWFGIDEKAKLFLISSSTLFPIYINTLHGIRSIDGRLLEMGRVYGLSRWGLFRHVLLPGALPSILVGLRYALGLMWLTLIVAETIAADSGIGYMIMDGRDFMRTDVVVLGIVLYALLGKTADLLARLLERKLLRWNPAYRH